MTSTLHIVVAMKPLDGNFASNAIKHGVAGLNIDACRIGTDDNLNGGAYSENGNRKAMDGDERMGAALGMFQPGKTVGSRFKNPQGRFPANVILEDSDKIVKAFPNRVGFSGGGIRKQKSEIMPSIVVREDGVASQTYCDTGSASRFFKQVKES